jgi:glyoxylase-like metal-dependent hydrolase (beta-lactamase superfamily II)
MKIHKIKNRGTLFTSNSAGWDLNIYLIQGKNINFVIDTGLGAYSVAPIIEHMKDDNKPTVVINTHYHWDHVWGNGSFKGCIIVAHQLCREMMLSQWEQMMQRNGRYCQGEVLMQLPNLVFEKELYFAEDGIRIFHTPGHTADSISVLDEGDSVLMLADNIGDSMDEILPSINCERDLYRQTMERYETMDFDVCISGHNKPLGKEVIRRILDLP